MPDLQFQVESAAARKHAATPQLVLQLKIISADPQDRIQNILLQCQIQLQVQRRNYTDTEKQRLKDLFGEPDRWGETLRTMYWMQLGINVPAFQASTTVDLPVPCTFDFNVAASKYFYGLEDGDVPLELLFSGTIFQQTDAGLQVSQIPWSRATTYRLPVRVWQDMMDHYYPGSAWLRLRRDIFDRLYQFKVDQGIPTWEQALERLLAHVEEAAPPMNTDLVDRIVHAVLYEGYILYPYRASAVKNRQRFNFGTLYPRRFSEQQAGTDACSLRMECLVAGQQPSLQICSRFLHPLERQIGEFPHPQQDFSPHNWQPVEALEVAGQIHQTWQEVVERDISLRLQAYPDRPNLQTETVTFPASETTEPLTGEDGLALGLILRRQQPLCAYLEVELRPLEPRLFQVRVRLENQTPFADKSASRDAALLRSLASAHLILQATNGQFISLLDPPPEHVDHAAACHNQGCWPVLVGDQGQTNLLLASPIILYDYPEVAPESAGDFFDGMEIDEMLALRVMTLTDEEKRHMRDVDARARQILERTDAMPPDQFRKLHGILRPGTSAGGPDHG